MPRPPWLARAGPPGRTGAWSEAAGRPAAPCRAASYQARDRRSWDPAGGQHQGAGSDRSLPALHDPGPAGLARRILARRILARRILARDDSPRPSLAAQIGINVI